MAMRGFTIAVLLCLIAFTIVIFIVPVAVSSQARATSALAKRAMKPMKPMKPAAAPQFSRFLAGDAAQRKKLADRVYNRHFRTRTVWKETAERRSESRHENCPCCGVRHSRCKRDFSAVERYFDRSAFNELLKSLRDAALLFASDTADCTELVKQLEKYIGKARLSWAWGYAAVHRYFNNPDLSAEANRKHVFKKGCTPRWQVLRALIADRHKKGKKIFGGFYDAPVMHAFRSAKGGRWTKTSRMTATNRDILAAKMVWDMTPSDELSEYE